MEATGQLIGQHNPKYEDTVKQTGFYPKWSKDVAIAGFEDIETFTFDVFVPHTHERWRGRLKASASVGGSMNPRAIERFDADLARLLRARFPEEPLMVRHRVFAVVCVARR
jgi:hypothetical protein